MTDPSRGSSEFLRFGIVGTIGFAVDAGTLYVLAPFVGWMIGRVISFLAAASTTWWLNRRYTFVQQHKAITWSQTGSQYLTYMLSMLIGGAVNYACYVGTMYKFDGPGVALVGVAIGSVAGLGVNFSLARWVVFKSAKVSQ